MKSKRPQNSKSQPDSKRSQTTKRAPQSRRSRTADSEDPISIEDLLRVTYEPPTEAIPDDVRVFAGWNGIMIDPKAVGENPRVGFQKLEMKEETGAWLMNATHAYLLGLPLLSKKVISRPGRTSPPKRQTQLPEPLHHPWNARNYHPTNSPFVEKVGKTAKGRRVVPTDAIDALFFGDDNRAPYYPTPYPWTCVGRLETATGVSMGTGALVGRNLVLTARHVILENPTPSIKFVPGYYNETSSSGASVFSWAKEVSYYEGSDYGAWDFALCALYQPLGDSLGFFGVRTYQDRWDDLYVWAAAGYPSMAPYNARIPSYLLGVAIDDANSDGDALELESENQDSSKGNSGGPLWAVWPNGPYIVGVTSANEHIDYGPFGDDYQVLNAGGKAMVDFVSLARIQIDTTIHINPPHIELGP